MAYVTCLSMLSYFLRYLFKNEKRVAIQELGPRFTLKLRSLQKGTFDSKFGEYEWIHKVLHFNLLMWQNQNASVYIV